MKLFLIDGHALIFKMYYAFLGRPMVNSKGVDTSILYGFTKYLLELVSREAPTHLAVSFDLPGGTFRNEMYPPYKANREATPQLVIDALEPLTEIVKALGIPVVTMQGFEADDVIGSVSKTFARQGFDVYMVTPDKDYGQLVEEHIKQYRPGHKNGENEILGIGEICEKWGVDSPLQVIDMLAICGDASDNVPGVKGVGQVGASKMIRKYGSVEAIYEHLNELAPRQRQMFEDARGHIALSKDLVTIRTGLDAGVSAEDMVLDASLNPAVAALFDLYEFPSLKRLLRKGMSASGPATAFAASSDVPAGSVDVRNAGVSLPEGTVAVALNSGSVFVYDGAALKSGPALSFRNVLESDAPKAMYAAKSQLKELSSMGIAAGGKIYDVELMHYLIDPERSHKLEVLAASYLGLNLEDAVTQSQPLSLFDEAPENDGPDMELRCKAIYGLSAALLSEMNAREGMTKLYEEIEEPLIRVLTRMEITGVKVDMDALRSYAEGLRKDLARLESEVRELAGVPDLNVSSPKQVGEVLFEKLALDPKAKKPKSGNWPTDEATLQELSDKSPIIDAILDYRGTKKLLGTYIDPFPSYVSEVDGRVHTTFNQALTSTGRLSSSNPNLQNIPIRTEQGREIRKAFVAGNPERLIMSADYSQIELRLMAHFSGDEHLCSAFREGQDVHSATASRIFGVPVEEVTSDMRRVAKTANFGIMYGISAFGLSQRLKCSRSEAKKIIEDYFTSFPSIRGFIDSTLAFAREHGYVETIFGRRRYVPDVTSSNATVRALAERNAVNAPVQGSAADIIKLAMIAVDRRLASEAPEAGMVLQIHDELLVELPQTCVSRVKNILTEEMEGVVKLAVPLTVECNYGKNWLDAH